MNEEIFAPSHEVREIRSENYIGKMATIELGHLNNEETSQYVTVRGLQPSAVDHLSGWVNFVLGEKGSTIRRKIKDFVIVEHRNGGRSRGEYKSYWDYFNARKDEIIKKFNMNSLMYALTRGGGDPDCADVIVRFKDFEIDSFAFSIEAPEEWYSECFKDNSKFNFADGFYPNAEKAIASFSMKSNNDLFGERYFPVVVFPKEKHKAAEDIIWRPKSHSKPIVKGDWLIYGTRCKSHEYEEVIEETYKAGGQVPIGLQWDWD